MASRDDYTAVAQEIANYFNAFRLAFKTYQIDDLDRMIKAKAGEGARLSTATVAEEFEMILLKRGFLCFPSLADAKDDGGGYVRIFRTGTAAANILQAFLNPGPTGDQSLSGLLRRLYAPRAAENDEPGSEETTRS